MLALGRILYVEYSQGVDIGSNAEFASLLKSNSYKPLIPVGEHKYITSQRLFAEKKAAGMDIYTRLCDFNRAIKGLTTYDEMLALGHILYVEYSQGVDIGSNAVFASLLISNSYKPLILLDPIAQQTIEQHLNDEQSKLSALGANSLSAAVKTNDPSAGKGSSFVYWC